MKKEDTVIDQDQLLDEAQSRVQENELLMKGAIANGSLREALRYADGMLEELRRYKLDPKQYYVLCKR
jgi:hypothetical protein